jgi:drug/metabolite transporter (DMT)-like permease
MFRILPILFAVGMAGIDAIALPIVKYINQGVYPLALILIPMLIYAFQPLLFYLSLNYSTLTSMNIMWDLMSDVIVTLIGLLYLKEKLHLTSKLGLVFAFIAILLFAKDGDKEKI